MCPTCLDVETLCDTGSTAPRMPAAAAPWNPKKCSPRELSGSAYLGDSRPQHTGPDISTINIIGITGMWDLVHAGLLTATDGDVGHFQQDVSALIAQLVRAFG